MRVYILWSGVSGSGDIRLWHVMASVSHDSAHDSAQVRARTPKVDAQTHTHGGALITCHSSGDDLAKTGRVSWSTTAGMYLVGYRVAGLRSGI